MRRSQLPLTATDLFLLYTIIGRAVCSVTPGMAPKEIAFFPHHYSLNKIRQDSIKDLLKWFISLHRKVLQNAWLLTEQVCALRMCRHDIPHRTLFFPRLKRLLTASAVLLNVSALSVLLKEQRCNDDVPLGHSLYCFSGTRVCSTSERWIIIHYQQGEDASDMVSVLR